MKGGLTSARPVYCVDTDMYFKSACQAAKYIGVNKDVFLYAVKKERPVKGHTFVFFVKNSPERD